MERFKENNEEVHRHYQLQLVLLMQALHQVPISYVSPKSNAGIVEREGTQKQSVECGLEKSGSKGPTIVRKSKWTKQTQSSSKSETNVYQRYQMN